MYGDGAEPAELPQTLIAVLAQAGRHWLPWVAEATVAGSATIELADGVTAEIASTPSSCPSPLTTVPTP